MTKFEKKPSAEKGRDPANASFIPEDYLERKADRRMGLITIALFCVVLFAVVGAFFVTNREWSTVRDRQEEINAQYAAEAKKIEQLKILEAQKEEMLEKAEVTTALVEKVPRSILLAELINRMPEDLTLTDFDLIGKRIHRAVAASPKDTRPKPRSLADRSGPRGTKENTPKPSPPSFEFTLEMVGLAATDNEVADYHASLLRSELLDRVDLMFSSETTIDDVTMRQFRIEAKLKPNADARHIEPLAIPRLRAPEFASGNVTSSLAGADEGREDLP